MGVFDRFRRNRQQGVLPDEVQEYYNSGRRQRRGVAVLFAFGALILTVVIAAALYFGGRAIYNAVRNDGTKNTSQQDDNKAANQDWPEGNSQQQSGSNSSNSGQNQQQSQSQSPPTPAPAPRPSSGSTPATGDAPALPHTGDPGM